MKKTVKILFFVQILLITLILVGSVYALFQRVGIPYPGYKAPFSFPRFFLAILIKLYPFVSLISLVVSILALRDKIAPRWRSVALLAITLLPLLYVAIAIII